MDIKGIKKRVGIMGNSAQNIFSAILAQPWIAKIMSYALRLSLGFLLSRAIILGGYSPFGLGYVAALGASSGSTLGIIGAVFGYFSILHMANGLKYVAICILIYTASFVFKGTSLSKKVWFMPLAALISAGAVGFVFVADAGFGITDVVFYLTELVLTTACAYFYQFYFNTKLVSPMQSETRRSIGTIVLLSTLFIPLAQIQLFGDVSLGRSLAVLCIMLAGYYGGMSLGSCAGIAFGLAIGIAQGTAQFCAIYGFAGLFSGVFCKKGKLIYTIIYILSNAAAMLWVTSGTNIALLYEAFFASVFFMLVSELFADTVRSFVTIPDEIAHSNYSERVRDFTRNRLNKASCAFRDLGDMLNQVFRRMSHPNENNIACVFDRPAQHICRKCSLSNACWEHDYITTKDALNSVTKAMTERGRLEATDFPLHFSSRCVKITEFVAAVNLELASYLYRKQYKSRLNESRNMVCKQYQEISHIFDDMASDLGCDPYFDERAEEKLRHILRHIDADAEPCVYRDMANHVHLQIEGTHLRPIMDHPEEYMAEFSTVLGIALTEPECESGAFGHRLIARQLEPLCASMGVAVHKKEDSDISGDSGSYFKLDTGKLCVILSDGMGTGKSAAVESSTAISILERFLKSGIDAKTALATINSALILKSEETGGFTTLDFMCTDLYNGETNFYKCGSAPTYIKRGRHIRRITSSSLPVGIPCSNASDIDSTRVKLHYGDYVILASDGVADLNDDLWLQTLVSEYEGESAKSLASDVLKGAFTKYGRIDDMTVMVIRIDKNA